MPFISDAQPSVPPPSKKYTSRKDMGGFGWHPDHGLYIPVVSQEDNITPPLNSGMEVTKILDNNRVVVNTTKVPAPAANFLTGNAG